MRRPRKRRLRFTTVSLPTPLFNRIRDAIQGTGFTSVSSYVAYVMREVLSEKGGGQNQLIDEEDRRRVRERLKALGYL